MNRHRLTLLCIALTLALASSGTAAQEKSRQDELERNLERLNGAITDAPSVLHHERAEVFFRLGRFDESVFDYDKAAQFGNPHDSESCWERGLAQYYAGDFGSARDQFARYHRVGSLDIENGLWHFLCIAEQEGIAKARETMQKYPRKVRPPFPALLDVYLNQGTAGAVLNQARDEASSAEDLTTNLFYAHYYLGKYYEIEDQPERALAELRESLKYEIPHFMYACAQADERRLQLRLVSEATQKGP